MLEIFAVGWDKQINCDACISHRNQICGMKNCPLSARELLKPFVQGAILYFMPEALVPASWNLGIRCVVFVMATTPLLVGDVKERLVGEVRGLRCVRICRKMGHFFQARWLLKCESDWWPMFWSPAVLNEVSISRSRFEALEQNRNRSLVRRVSEYPA